MLAPPSSAASRAASAARSFSRSPASSRADSRPGRRHGGAQIRHDPPIARLIYFAIASLDGYIEDASGKFDWGEPDEEVHAFVNDLERPVGTYLYGRRMYEVMLAWETLKTADHPPHMQDFAAIWRAAEKIVYSRTLATASSARTRIERDFDPDAVWQLKASAASDLAVAGPELAAHAFRAALVDELHLLLAPVVVGGGKKSLPNGVRLELELLDERGFGNGMVHLRYRVGYEAGPLVRARPEPRASSG
jgi:dihydrofolate reductase